jgi:hypothetical protein
MLQFAEEMGFIGGERIQHLNAFFRGINDEIVVLLKRFQSVMAKAFGEPADEQRGLGLRKPYARLAIDKVSQTQKLSFRNSAREQLETGKRRGGRKG